MKKFFVKKQVKLVDGTYVDQVYSTIANTIDDAKLKLSMQLNENVLLSMIQEDESYVEEQKQTNSNLRAYLCWYMSYNQTQYIYIIAENAEQAYMYYCQHGYNHMVDYMDKQDVLRAPSYRVESVINYSVESGDVVYA